MQFATGNFHIKNQVKFPQNLQKMADVDPGDVEELSLYDSGVKPLEKPAKKPRISEVGDGGLVESKIEAEKEESVEDVKSGDEENDEQKVPEWSPSSVKERVEINPNPFMLIPQLTESETEFEFSDDESVGDILEAIGELKPNDILFYCDGSDSEGDEVEIEFCEVRNTVMIFKDSDVEE